MSNSQTEGCNRENCLQPGVYEPSSVLCVCFLRRAQGDDSIPKDKNVQWLEESNVSAACLQVKPPFTLQKHAGHQKTNVRIYQPLKNRCVCTDAGVPVLL